MYKHRLYNFYTMEQDANPIYKHLHPDESDEFFTDERCHILELINSVDDRSQSIARARVEPGITTAWHRLVGTQETIVVQQGEGRLELAEEEYVDVSVGDIVRIPKDTAQRITNTSEEDLIFLCFCIPAFGSHCYESLE